MSRPRAARRPVSMSRGSIDGPATGGQPRGERVERAAHFVDLGDPGRVERRDQHAAARRIDTSASFFSSRSACSTGWRETASRAAMSSCVRRAPGAMLPSLIASSSAR